ncbi:VIT1/CCC1 transporter family protein [Nakamurella lactea]|uniref:VIT1/CCC1 transporter family protein n=1 Tax=Nakamurella lactea TaxID=459515 RepID=UPI00041C094A|nr:VIT1/CCC1 transporter family protein [Nakamurella lactea]
MSESTDGRFARFRSALSDARATRSWTVDANDGILATAGILEGFAGAGATDATLLTAAFVAMIAGGLGLGGAKWAEEAAERDAQLRVIAVEAAELEHSPEAELAELADHYVSRGLAPDLARQVAEQLSARDALAAQLDAEHDIRQLMPRWAPAWAGVSAGAAFILGSLVPLLVSAFVPGAVEGWAILLTVVISLVITSFVSARRGHTTVSRTVARTLAVGVGTLGSSYLVGMLIF